MDNSIEDLLPQIVVAQYAFSKHSILLDPTAPLHIIGPTPTLRVAYTLPSLVRLTSRWSVMRASRCRASKLRREARISRYLFRVSCSEDYSRGPHIVRIQVLPGEEGKPLRDRQVLVSCSCEFWIYWGPDWNAQQKGYLEGSPRSNGVPAGVRDPGHKNWICKHCLVAAKLFYKETPPEDLLNPITPKSIKPIKHPPKKVPQVKPKEVPEEPEEEPSEGEE